MLHFHVEGATITYALSQIVYNVTPVMYERETKKYELYKAKEWIKPRYFKKDIGVSKDPRIARVLFERGRSSNFFTSYVESFDFYLPKTDEYCAIELVDESAPQIEENILAEYYRKVRTTNVYSVGNSRHVITHVQLFKHPIDEKPEVEGYCQYDWPDSTKRLYSSLEYVLRTAKRESL